MLWARSNLLNHCINQTNYKQKAHLENHFEELTTQTHTCSELFFILTLSLSFSNCTFLADRTTLNIPLPLFFFLTRARDVFTNKRETTVRVELICDWKNISCVQLHHTHIHEACSHARARNFPIKLDSYEENVLNCHTHEFIVTFACT